jgi:hypothetical protein
MKGKGSLAGRIALLVGVLLPTLVSVVSCLLQLLPYDPAGLVCLNGSFVSSLT